MEVSRLDSYRAKLKAIESQIDVKGVKLAHQEASLDEAMAWLQKTLMVVLDREKKMAEEIAYFEELHESHLAKAMEAHKAKLATQVEAIREEL